MWEHINTVNLFGLVPFLVSIKRHRYSTHSRMVVLFGVVYHTNNHIPLCRHLDIVQCFLNGGLAFWYGKPVVKWYVIFVLVLYFTNLNYLGNNKWIHLMLQWAAARGLFLHEENLNKIINL